jgi:hypothetical protein
MQLVFCAEEIAQPVHSIGLNKLLRPFTIIKPFSFFSKMHVSRRVLVCRFTHFSLYLAQTEISKRSSNSEQREYYQLGVICVKDRYQ